MKIPKSYLGKFVEVTWLDPNSWRGSLEGLVKGKAALATWKEYGLVYDVTEGIVLLAHSLAQSPGSSEADEIVRTAIHEDLIEGVIVFTPEVVT